MQCTNPEVMIMSLNFGDNNINQFKAQSAYKDASGMGGGGMYFQQRKKKQDEEEQDVFEFANDEKKEGEILFDSEPKEDTPSDAFFNKFVNWFRLKRES